MPLTAEQIQEFVTANAMSRDDARRLASDALEPGYWTSICPWLSLSTQRPRVSSVKESMTDVTVTLDEYRRCGYGLCEDVFEVDDLNSLARAICAVQSAGWPMVFSFVYDQFWTLLDAPKLRAFLTSVFGPTYQTTARFLVNYVPATAGGSGFPPHIDGGRDHTATCWVPLTPASPDNGGIYVVQRTTESRSVLTEFKNLEAFNKQQMMLLLAHTRAVPMNPGGFVAWPQDTIHWGGQFRRGTERLAISWEFMGAQHENIDDMLPLALHVDQPLPEFENRLRWICHSVSKTLGRDMVLQRFLPVIKTIQADERIKSRSKKAIGAQP
ncbi:MAG TPA: phytanoyl-CoA dioxygenase family protein [Pyrinomonadaceae bacterium]|nr:phytanoyl-CoA dioxygenase family protein [Pyrinomonadaceae bacterium]